MINISDKISIKPEISDVLQSVLDTTVVNTDRLNENHYGICIKDELDTIIKNINKSWAPVKATIASVVAKLGYPKWDTRKHQKQIGGYYSLRSIDANYISSTLFKEGLYDSLTPFALTRSFEKAEPFNQLYNGQIKPVECKSAFLNIVEVINTTNDPHLVLDILHYMIYFLKKRKELTAKLNESVLVVTMKLDLLDVSHICDYISDLRGGSSRVPVIIVHTLLSIVKPFLWSTINLIPLKEHTASDNHCNAYGDIEATYHDSTKAIVIEVKHKIAITSTIIMSFDKKTCNTDIPLKFIITTAMESKRFYKNNICIDSFKNFILTYLHQVYMYDKNIYQTFVQEIRNVILKTKNLDPVIKQEINKYIITHLV